jgi:hypothetical protein
MPDHRKAARSWSERGMPERVRQAIASVRRISIEEAAELDDQGREPLGLREAPGRFAPVNPPEPSAPLDTSEPSLLDIREPSAPFDASELSPTFDESEPPPPLDTFEPSAPLDTSEPLNTSEPPPFLDTREPPLPDTPAPPPAPDTPGPLPTLDAPARRPHWRHSEEEPPPGPGRGIRIAAVVMASAVVLLVGSGLGVLLVGWQLELPSLPTGTAAPPEPVAESEPPPAVASTSEAPPPIAEVTRVEPAPMPPAPAIERSPPDAAAIGGMPLPPPPKPAPWSSVAAEGPTTTDDAVEDALDALLRETDGSGGPFEPLDEEEAPLAAIRVFVHYTASAAGEEATARHLARHLEAKGFAVEAREVNFPIDFDSIRYFFPADRNDAEALSASLEGQVPGGAAPPVLDFTDYEPKPSPGYLELWIGT